VLVYGDHCEFADSLERFADLRRKTAAAAQMPAGIERHAKLVGALIDAGQLLQGVADAEAPADELADVVHRLATCVVRSWDTGFAQFGDLPALPQLEVPRWVELRLPEGFAFYAVYPEAYIEAARRLSLSGMPRIIGIRSIGTTLAAIVSAALDAPGPITVRPFGDPFARRVELPPETIEADAHYVIVDEGPGLSGSSFGAVADWLERRGVSLDRIAFLPSHAGDLGPRASDAHRQRWRRAQRIPAQFEPAFLREMFGPLEDFSTGSAWERRKYIGTQHGLRVLLKFAGLGAIGERKLEMARALHAAGFTPEPLGLVHGFLVERWCEDAQPLAGDDKPVEEIGRYIGARALLFRAEPSSGATVDELLTMCRRNIGLAVGDDLARGLDRWDPQSLSSRVARVRTDNKLDREEWLRLTGGRLLKADALDHHQAHDLIGCQDLAWDIAGALVEFELNADDAGRLIAASEKACGRRVDQQLLEFSRVAYCAFRLGQAALAAGKGSGCAFEQPWASPSARRYVLELQLLLQRTRAATRRESLVD
jgi:hypothetical protein